MSQVRKVGPAALTTERQQTKKDHNHHHFSQNRFRVDRPDDRKYSCLRSTSVNVNEVLFAAVQEGGN